MPRIPFSLASGEVPGRIPTERPQYAVWAAPGRAIQNLGEQIQETTDTWREVDRRIQAGKDAVAQATLINDIKTRAAELKMNPDISVSSTEYRNRVSTELTAMLDQGIGQISERNREAVRAAAIKDIGTYAIEAQGSSAARSSAEIVSEMYRLAEQKSQLGTLESLAEIQILVRDLARNDHLTPAQARDTEAFFRRRTIENAFAVKKMANPKQAFDEVNGLQGIFATLTNEEKERYLAEARQQSERDEDRINHLKDRQEREQEEQARIYSSAKAGNMVLALRTGQLTRQALPPLLEGLPLADILHVTHAADQLEAQGRELKRFDRAEQQITFTNARNAIMTGIPLNKSTESLLGIVRQAEIALIQKNIEADDLVMIKEHVQQQIRSNQQDDRQQLTDAESALVRARRLRENEYASTRKEIARWFNVDAFSRSSPEVRRALDDAVKTLEAEGIAEIWVDGGSPRKAMLEKFPEANVALWDGIGNAEKEAWRTLAPYTIVQEAHDAIKGGKIRDPQRAWQMGMAIRTLAEIEKYRVLNPNPSPQAVGEVKPKPQYVPPTRGQIQWAPGEMEGPVTNIGDLLPTIIGTPTLRSPEAEAERLRRLRGR